MIKPIIESEWHTNKLLLSSGGMLPTMHGDLWSYAFALTVGGLGSAGPNLVWIYYFVSKKIVFETLDSRGFAGMDWQKIHANSNLVYKQKEKESDQQLDFWAGHKIPGSFIDNKVLDADKPPVSCQSNRTLEKKNIYR